METKYVTSIRADPQTHLSTMGYRNAPQNEVTLSKKC